MCSNDAMTAHRTRVQVPPDHRVTITLPDDFPSPEAEVIVMPLVANETEAREPFGVWLDRLLAALPRAPLVPLVDATRRENLYD